MTNPTCETCRYWHEWPNQNSENSGRGQCRIIHVYEYRLAGDWCGEHKPSKPELKTAPTIQEHLDNLDGIKIAEKAKQVL